MRFAASRRFASASVAAALALLLAGCSGSSVQPSAASSALAGRGLAGTVFGGQQPVAFASIQMYAPGGTGYASAATPLLRTPTATDANGNFSITGNYTCPSADTPVYLAVNGGNPGLAPGTSNAALVLVAVLGPCGALTPSTYVTVNELSTVAAAYALAPFMADAAHVGAPASNQAGLFAALVTANRLVSLSGNAPGNAPALASVPATELFTLGDIVSSCVNTNGSLAAGSGCGRLFAAVVPANGPALTDTLAALLAIVRDPAHNAATLFYLTPTSGPYQPTLATAPPDWSVAINYTAPAFRTPSDLAIDGGGTVWITAAPGTLGNGSSTLSALSTAGIQATYPQQFTVFSNLAIDRNGFLWLSDGPRSAVTELSPSGSAVGTFTGGGLSGPGPLAFDPAGNLWISNNGPTLSKLAASGTTLSPAGGYATGGTSGPASLAVDATGRVWTADGGGSTVTQLSSAGVRLNGSPFTGAGLSSPSAIAIDAAGRATVSNSGSSSLTRFAADGAPPASVQLGGAGLVSPLSLALDGAGVAWAANAGSNTVSAVAADGTSLSGTAGLGAAALTNPYRLALDASGNVWVLNLGSKVAGAGTVTQIVGAARPVLTPLSAAVAQGKLATRP